MLIDILCECNNFDCKEVIPLSPQSYLMIKKGKRRAVISNNCKSSKQNKGILLVKLEDYSIYTYTIRGVPLHLRIFRFIVKKGLKLCRGTIKQKNGE